MLLFSETFINKLADKLKNELDFFPAKLRIKNDEFKVFLGKIKLTARLVDMEKSNFLWNRWREVYWLSTLYF